MPNALLQRLIIRTVIDRQIHTNSRNLNLPHRVTGIKLLKIPLILRSIGNNILQERIHNQTLDQLPVIFLSICKLSLKPFFTRILNLNRILIRPLLLLRIIMTRRKHRVHQNRNTNKSGKNRKDFPN